MDFFKYFFFYSYRYDQASLVAQMVKNWPAMQETWIQSLGWEDPLEEGMQPTPITVHEVAMSWTQLDN